MLKSVRLFFIFCFFLLAFSLSFSPVLAQDVYWSTPVKINTSSNNALSPKVFTGPNGYLHTVWMEIVGENWSGTTTPGIFYSFWNGDVWSTPVKISQDFGAAELPSIVVTADNTIHVTWDEDTGGDGVSQVYYSSKANGSGWTTPISLSAPLGTTEAWGWSSKITADSSNNLHAVFSFNVALSGVTDVYYRKFSGGSWSDPVKISGQNHTMQHSDMIIDSNNKVHVLMWDDGNASPGDPDYAARGGIYYATDASGSWTLSERISALGMFPRLVIDSTNTLHAVWYSMYLSTLEYSNKTPSGSWTAPYQVSTNVAPAYWWNPLTGLTIDNSNNVYAGWGEASPTGANAVYRKRNASSGLWDSTQLLRETNYFDSAFIYRDKWFNQHFAWTERNAATGEWEFWYSTIPANVQTYNPASALSMTLVVSGDTLSIPKTSLAQSTTISAMIGPLPSSTNPLYTTLPRSYTFRPHGLTFIGGTKVATAVIKYTDAEVVGANEAALKVYIWDGTINNWSSSFTTLISTSKNTATVTLPHFSLYGIMAPRIITDWLDWARPIDKRSSFKIGSTIPIKFKMANADDSPFDPGQDVKVAIFNSSGIKVAEFIMGTGNESLRYNANTKEFIANFSTKNLPKDDYKIQVTLFDNLVGEITISLVTAEGLEKNQNK